jgi:hypothetical protein
MMNPEKVDDITEEIEKLQVMKIELTNKMNTTVSFDDKERFKEDIANINAQIDILEKFKNK